ncbi:MAG: D-alanine--D-alanine ligase [Syntrophomonadaceae bacterium]|nr:D-alanine--D-alanine ligase [Syntrophomonadaceae bacterium]
MAEGKIRVAVLFGGRSGEHEVSINSAASVIAALDKEKYEVLPVAITKEGEWLVNADLVEAGLKGSFGNKSITGTLLADPKKKGFALFNKKEGILSVKEEQVEVIIPILHGTYGEDGTVQGLLELSNLPYVGAGVLASALGMDKVVMKSVFAQHGLPQTDFIMVLRRDVEENLQRVVTETEEALGYPCFVKPANLGSSVGISKAKNRDQLAVALREAARYDRKLIIEKGIDAREIEVSVLGNDAPEASLPGEIIPSNEFYDYEAKYVDGKSQLIIPADLPPETVQEVRRLAVAAFKAIDCSGMARVDFFLTRDTGEVLVNEINTIPGFTRFSMYPKLWEASGLPYSRLLDRLIELAIERHADKNKSETTYTMKK